MFILILIILCLGIVTTICLLLAAITTSLVININAKYTFDSVYYI